MILSIPSPASCTRTLRRHGPGSLSVCKAPKTSLLGKQNGLRGCTLWPPTHCKSHCLSHTHPLSAFWVWSRHRLYREKKLNVLDLHLDVSPSVQAPFASCIGWPERRSVWRPTKSTLRDGLSWTIYTIALSLTPREPWLSLSKAP